jgi:hypothetical protein
MLGVNSGVTDCAAGYQRGDVMCAEESSAVDARVEEIALDDIEAYVATFDEDDRRRLAAAEAEIDNTILVYRLGVKRVRSNQNQVEPEG